MPEFRITPYLMMLFLNSRKEKKYLKYYFKYFFSFSVKKVKEE